MGGVGLGGGGLGGGGLGGGDLDEGVLVGASGEAVSLGAAPLT